MKKLQYFIRNHISFAFIFFIWMLYFLLGFITSLDRNITDETNRFLWLCKLLSQEKYIWLFLAGLCFIIGAIRIILYRKYITDFNALKAWILPNKKIIGKVTSIIPVWSTPEDRKQTLSGRYVIIYPINEFEEQREYKSDINNLNEPMNVWEAFEKTFKELTTLHKDEIATPEEFYEYIKDFINIDDKYTITISLDNPNMYNVEPIEKTNLSL